MIPFLVFAKEYLLSGKIPITEIENHLVLQYLWFNQILDNPTSMNFAESIPKIEIAKVFATKEKTNYSAKEIIPIVCIVSKMRNWKNLEI